MRSKAYNSGTSDWLTVSFAGDCIVWRDPVDTGAKVTTVSGSLTSPPHRLSCVVSVSVP